MEKQPGKRESDSNDAAPAKRRCIPLEERECWITTQEAAQFPAKLRALVRRDLRPPSSAYDINDEELRFVTQMGARVLAQAKEIQILQRSVRRARCPLGIGKPASRYPLGIGKSGSSYPTFDCALCGGLWSKYQYTTMCESCAGKSRLDRAACDTCTANEDAYGRAPIFCDICDCEHCGDCKCIGAE